MQDNDTQTSDEAVAYSKCHGGGGGGKNIYRNKTAPVFKVLN